jgi:amino acid adenylation domain-containing protein
MAVLARNVDGALEDKKALPLPPIEPVAADRRRPVSFAQQRLWLVDQLMPGSAAYNVPTAFRLTGPLNVTVLERSFREVVRRHEALRTGITTMEGQLVQTILPDRPFSLAVVDLSGLPADSRAAECQRRIGEEAHRPFDLEHGPLLRAGLLRLGPEEHALLLTIHHIASDGWSMGILYHEVATLYAAFARGGPSPLPELPIQYPDYAVWQRRWMQGEALQDQLDYWKQKLDGLAQGLELPTDRPRPAVPAFQGARPSIELPSRLAEGLRTLGRHEGTTLFMTSLAAFQALLHRYTGQRDIAVGSPIAGRTRRELHKLIGCFINMIVLRADLSGDPTFRELLRRVREVAVGAYAHQDLPFERLVEELQGARGPGRHPLFQVMFALHKAPTWGPGLPGVEITPLKVDNGTAKYDLTLTMIETEAGLTCDLEYDTELFDAATAARMMEHFQLLLEAAVADPDRRLSELPILTEAERHQLLVGWNDTRCDYPTDRSVPDLFREQAARTPDAVAVASKDQALSYAALNARTNRLAHRLRALGVGPESLVGLCVGRSPAMVVGLLGILKAGGAYVPLDPELPKGRLALMLDDAQVGVVVTETALRDALAAVGAPVAELVLDGEDPGAWSDEDPGVTVAPENLAYVIYTSGSTGKPKGVQVTHGALTNFLLSMRARFPMTARDTLLAITTLSFDIAGLEIYLPLIQGARVELAGRDEALDGAWLARRLVESSATFLQATPPTWRLLLEGGWPGTPGLTMLCGGEALPRDLADRLHGRGAALWNLYGPTETTIWSSAARVENGEGPVTIGRPIANTQMYVLDAHLRPVPVGVVGDLFIGGAGLARGYLGRPNLSAEKFIPDPFGGQPGARLYRTGDRARYRADREIEFLGRVDDQVKIRGFRIEPGEIESALRRYPAVSQAAVLVREDPIAGKRLVAFVAPHPGQTPAARDLRNFLRDRLPAYMIPSSFTLLEALPLTFSGKIDRRALPDPRPAPLPTAQETASPHTPIECAISEVFREILGVDPVYLHDSFIDLGGHSLQSVEAITRLEQRIGLRLTPRELLLQTLGQLALTCEEHLALARTTRPRGLVRGMLQVIKRLVLPGATRRGPPTPFPLGHRS